MTPMEQLHQLSLSVAEWLQTSFPQLAGLMQIISMLGDEEAFLVLMPLFYWSLDKRLGKSLAYVFLISVTLNPILKNAFRGPRPFWLDSGLGLGEATGYGLPSGHAQHTTVLYLFLALWLRRWYWWLLALVMIPLMALSRVYLGVHFVTDVLGGLLVGSLILLGYMLARYRFEEGYNKRNLGRRLFLMIIPPLVLLAVYVVVLLIIGRPDDAVAWSSYIPSAELDAREGVATGIGALLGYSIGMIYESSRVRFRTAGPVWQRVARYVLGIVVTVGLWAGLRAIFPDDPQWLALPLRVVRYFVILLWVSLVAPWVFVKLGLATADPESEIRVTI